MNTEIRFRQLLEIIREKNPNAFEALGQGLSRSEIQSLINIQPVPEGLMAIYTCVEGLSLKAEAEYDGILPPFLPGWDLRNIHEINEEIDLLDSTLSDLDFYKKDMIPFLRNAFGDNLCIRSLPNDQSIWYILHDGEPGIVHKNMDNFIINTMECYKQNAYYFDEDEGYWESDFDLVLSIREELDPDMEFVAY